MEAIGVWTGRGTTPAFKPSELLAVATAVRSAGYVVQHPTTGALGVAQGGRLSTNGVNVPAGTPGWPVFGILPSI